MNFGKVGVIALLLIGFSIFFLVNKSPVFAETTPWNIDTDTLDSNKLKFYYQEGITNAPLTLMTDGNVGIGVINPSAAKLQIGGGNVLIDNNFAYAQKSTSGGTVGLLKLASDNTVNIGALSTTPNNNGHLLFYANGREKMRINPNGYVGIGTKSPKNTLDVQGGVHISGAEISTTGEATIMQDNLDSIRSVIDQAGTQTHFRLSAANPISPGVQHFLIAPYTYGMSIQWLGTLEFWVQDISFRGYAPDGAREGSVWVDDKPDSGGWHFTTNSSPNQVIATSETFWNSSHGSMIFRVRDNTDNFLFQSGAKGAESTKFILTADGKLGIGTEDPGNDSLDVRGSAYASGGWQTVDADYAEWFEKEEDAKPGDIIGINLLTGKARKYQPGDKLIGIYSTNPAVVGNRSQENDEEMQKNSLLVGLLGQLDFDKSQTSIIGQTVYTFDGKEIGTILSNNKILIGR